MPSPPRWAPLAARAAAQRVVLDAQRELQLERLDRRVERVRHRDVDAARAVGAGARALAAAERLVVRERARCRASRLFIVPWPCAGAERAERGEHEVGDALDVSTLPATTAAGGAALTRRARGRA